MTETIAAVQDKISQFESKTLKNSNDNNDKDKAEEKPFVKSNETKTQRKWFQFPSLVEIIYVLTIVAVMTLCIMKGQDIYKSRYLAYDEVIVDQKINYETMENPEYFGDTTQYW